MITGVRPPEPLGPRYPDRFFDPHLYMTQGPRLLRDQGGRMRCLRVFGGKSRDLGANRRKNDIRSPIYPVFGTRGSALHRRKAGAR